MGDRNYLGLDREHERPVLQHEKTKSLRYEPPYTPEQGDTLYAVISHDEGPFAKLRVTDVYEITAEEVVASEFEGHRNYDSLEHLENRLQNYYDIDVQPTTPLTMIEFTVVNETNKQKQS